MTTGFVPLVDRPESQYTNPATDADIKWMHDSMCMHIRLPWGSRGVCETERRIRAAFDRERQMGVELGQVIARHDAVLERKRGAA
jgi:hypothetical protein